VHYVFNPGHYIGIVIANTTLLYKWKKMSTMILLHILQDQKYSQNGNERVKRKVIMCNVIHGYILILNFFHLIWKIYNSIGRNLILKYCPRIIFYIKNNPPERILWRIK
jgi:hypothetical protein